MVSARVLICCSPNMSLRSEKTRSHDAEFGEMAKTMRAASAHCLKPLPFVHQMLIAVTSLIASLRCVVLSIEQLDLTQILIEGSRLSEPRLRRRRSRSRADSLELMPRGAKIVEPQQKCRVLSHPPKARRRAEPN